jgi:hypothetical protein
MKNTTLTITAPDGYEIMSDMPTSIMNDDSCLFVRYDIKPIAHPQVDKHAELKAQYQRDVETCKDIDGLEVWRLWQVRNFNENKTWITVHKIFEWTADEYRRHPHADSMIQYHQCSERDKQRWQYAYRDTWLDCNGEPDWYEHTLAFRLKPETITINGKEYNAPLRDSKGIDGEYVYLDLNSSDFFASISDWDNDFCDNKRLNAGLIFSSSEDCQAVANAFNAILHGDL